MKDADFQNLLQGIREAGSSLRGNKKAAARVDHIDPESVAANSGAPVLRMHGLPNSYTWDQSARCAFI
jgi:hypothetical protein